MSTNVNGGRSSGHLRPALLPQVSQQLRSVRGEPWCFLENSLTGRQVRLNASAWSLIRQLDGRTRLDSLVGSANDASLTPEEAERCLQMLASAGMLSVNAAGQTDSLLAQRDRATDLRRRQRLWNPLAVRLPLHDPNEWLTRLLPWFGFLFTRLTAIALCGLLLTSLAIVTTHSEAIGKTLAGLTASPGQWWLVALVYPCLKAIHELAHAVCIKRWGGAVHEMGITFLVLIPVPHVDASAASLFSHRYQRMLVSAAGMLAEGAIAALALLLWCLVEPGPVKDIAFVTAVTGSVSTLLFNANPLLRFDGYYMLQDWLDIPNLATRAAALYRHLFKTHLLGVKQSQAPLLAAGERRWLLVYAPAALVYRYIITFGIALFLAQHYAVIGTALALLALGHLVVVPLWRGLQYLRSSEELEGRRSRATLITAAVSLCGVILVTAIPLPASTRTQGIVSVPEQAQVFAPEDGAVVAVLVEKGELVSAGQPLIRLSNPALEAELASLDAQGQTLQVSEQAAWRDRADKAQQMRTDIQLLQRREQRLKERIAALQIRAPRAGRFAPNPALTLAGQHVRRGDLLGYSVDAHDLRVMAVIEQRRLGEVNEGITQASVRLAERLQHSVPATLIRQTPAGSHHLPSPALADGGNGGIAVTASTAGGKTLQTVERVFQIELGLPIQTLTSGIGGRAYVTLHHQPESLASRLWRAIRQLLLSRLAL